MSETPKGLEKKTPVIFVAFGHGVKQGSEQIALAKSKTMARRIANALNRYTPNEKGY